MDIPVLTPIRVADRAERGTPAKLAVLFVHGITGDRFSTWSAGEGRSWLSWVAADEPDMSVYTASYDSSFFSSWCKGPGPSLTDRAMTLADAIVRELDKFQGIAIVTYSLGGIITKQMLRKCADSVDPAYAKLLTKLRGVIFIATPHQGANVATALGAILGSLSSRSLNELKAGADALCDLNEWYRNWAARNQVPTAAYYETQKTRGAMIVDKVTGNPFVAGCDPVAVDADHIGICKPQSRNAPIYASVSRRLTEFAGVTPQPPDTPTSRPERPPEEKPKRQPGEPQITKHVNFYGNKGVQIGIVEGDYNNLGGKQKKPSDG